MIVGNGMIAKAFDLYRDNDKVCLFASGVSNSREIEVAEFEREYTLLKKTIEENREKVLLYFSTLSINDKSLASSPYVVHKKNIERYIQSENIEYYIFRLTQVVGHATNETLVRNFFNKIINEENITIFNKATRNLIDIDDVHKIVNFLVDRKLYKNTISTIASPFQVTPLELIMYLEEIVGKKAVYTVEDIGEPYDVDIEYLEPHLGEIGVSFPETYTRDIIRKYFSNHKESLRDSTFNLI